MRHAEKLIARIFFLEGKQIVSKLNQIIIGAQVQNIHEYDPRTEYLAIKIYNGSINVAAR